MVLPGARGLVVWLSCYAFKLYILASEDACTTRDSRLPNNLFRCLTAHEDEYGVWQGYVNVLGNSGGWWQVFEPTHNFVFFEKNGKPFTSERFCGLFKQVAYRLTGKACNLQLIRDLAIAHLMNSRASVEVMKSLADEIGS